MDPHQKSCIAIFSLIIALTCIHTGLVYFRSKKTVSLYAFIANQLFLVCWLYFGMIEKMSSSLEELLINVRFTLPFALIMGPSWLFYAYHYRKDNIRDSFRLKTLWIFIPTIVLILPLYIPDLFHLVIVEKTFGYASKTIWGPLFKMNYLLTMAMILLSLVLILKEAYRRTKKAKVVLIYILGVSIPFLINTLSLMDVIESPGFDLTPIGYYIFSLITAWLILKYQFLEVIPQDLYTLILTLSDGIVIVDYMGEMMAYNSALERMFPQIIKGMKDKRFEHFMGNIASHSDSEFLPGQDDLLTHFKASSEPIELSYVNDLGIASSIVISKGDFEGIDRKRNLSIYAFKDITQYQEKVIDAERNRVSYDLHDRLGNDLNAIRNHLEYALEHAPIESDVQNSIQMSYERSTKAFLELKRIVDNLNSETHENQDLKIMLTHFFQKVALGGVEVDFICPDLDQIEIDTKQVKDILLICQEAVTNAVVHGRAEKITVSIKIEREMWMLYIIDDGVGTKEIIKGHGIKSMERRVKLHRGTISYGSPSVGGFNIRIEMPL